MKLKLPPKRTKWSGAS